MITTSSLVKIVVFFKLLMHMGSYRICCLLYPAPFKMFSLLMLHLLAMLTTFNIVGYIKKIELNTLCGVLAICNFVAYYAPLNL